MSYPRVHKCIFKSFVELCEVELHDDSTAYSAINKGLSFVASKTQCEVSASRGDKVVRIDYPRKQKPMGKGCYSLNKLIFNVEKRDWSNSRDIAETALFVQAMYIFFCKQS